MDINSYIQRSKRTLDDIWEVVQRLQRENDDLKQRNRFLEQSNSELNTDINRFRLRCVELQARLDSPIESASTTAQVYNEAGFHI